MGSMFFGRYLLSRGAIDREAGKQLEADFGACRDSETVKSSISASVMAGDFPLEVWVFV